MSDKIKEYEKIVYIRAVGTEHLFQVGSEDIKAKFSKTKITHTFRPGDIGYGLFNTSGDINWLNEYHTEKDYIALLDEVMINQFNTEQEEEKQKTLFDKLEKSKTIDTKEKAVKVAEKIIKGIDLVDEDKPLICKENIIRAFKEEPIDNVFKTLSKVECNVDKKGKFNYVSWANAWEEVKKHYPNATFKVYETEAGFPAFIKPKLGGFVKVGVTINNLEHVEHFPILNFNNKAILEPDVFDINKAIKRGLAKAIALHGLGLYIFRGEELPEGD